MPEVLYVVSGIFLHLLLMAAMTSVGIDMVQVGHGKIFCAIHCTE